MRINETKVYGKVPSVLFVKATEKGTRLKTVYAFSLEIFAHNSYDFAFSEMF